MKYARLAGRIGATMAMVVLALLGARWMWQKNEAEPWTRDGRIRADIVDVSPDVSGLVTDVLVHDNQPVHRGQPLFLIDRPRFELALRQADGNVAAAHSALAQAERENRRNHVLGDLVSAELVEEGAAKVEQLRASLAQANAARDVAALNLQRTTVPSPVDGVVTNTEMRPGDYLQAGHPALALVYGGSLHAEGYFEETKLPAVRVGDPARIELMGVAIPVRGHVESIAGGVEDRERGPSGDLLANINPTFSWVRLPQRIPVRIAIDDVPPGVRLIPGSTATVIVTPRIARPLVPRSFPW